MRGEDRAYERAGTGDGGEVVAEDNPFVGGDEVVAVVETFGGRGAPVVESHDAGGDEFSIETVADQVCAAGGGHQPEAVDVLTAAEGDCAQADGRRAGQKNPQNTSQKKHQISVFGDAKRHLRVSEAGYRTQEGGVRNRRVA